MVLKNVLTLFILVFVGYIIGKRGILKSETAPEISDFIIKVTVPCTIFNSMQSQYDAGMIKSAVVIFLVTISFHVAALLISAIVRKICRIPDGNKGVFDAACMFSNNGFMGFPLILALYGNEGLFLMSIANVVSNFLIFSLGESLILMDKKGNEEKFSFFKTFRLTNINIAVILGLICYITQIHLPQMATDTLNYLADITAGLSMIVVGLSMSKYRIKSMFSGRTTYIASALRLIILPLMMLAVIKLIPWKISEAGAAVIMLTAALPSPMGITMIGESNDMDIEYGTRIVFMTTLLSVITVPVFISLAL